MIFRQEIIYPPYQEIINLSRDAYGGEGGYLDLLRNCLIYMESYTCLFTGKLAQGLVLKAPYFLTSFYQILILNVPE